MASELIGEASWGINPDDNDIMIRFYGDRESRKAEYAEVNDYRPHQDGNVTIHVGCKNIRDAARSAIHHLGDYIHRPTKTIYEPDDILYGVGEVDGININPL